MNERWRINTRSRSEVIDEVGDVAAEVYATSTTIQEQRRHLVAAAPELLAMLQQIRIALPVTLDRYRVGFCRDIDTLLAKATGQEVGR